MQLSITRRTDLATRALLTLDRSGEKRKASDLAAELDASAGFLAQAMTPLVNQGWVHSEPGPTGGYRVVVSLDDVSVLDVVEAVEGPTDVTRCVLEGRPCNRGGRCALHDAWARARADLLQDLAETPLSSVPARPIGSAVAKRASTGEASRGR
jgi:Rrf2 family protein